MTKVFSETLALVDGEEARARLSRYRELVDARLDELIPE
jgi:hypothetical protein